MSETMGIYVRTSRMEDEAALANQRAELTTLCERNGWAYRIYEETTSGASLADRPQLKRMLEDAEFGEVDGIVVASADRLIRGADTMDEHIIRRYLMETKVYMPDGTCISGRQWQRA